MHYSTRHVVLENDQIQDVKTRLLFFFSPLSSPGVHGLAVYGTCTYKKQQTQVSVLNRVAQMHEALASIVKTCEREKTSMDHDRGNAERAGAGESNSNNEIEAPPPPLPSLQTVPAGQDDDHGGRREAREGGRRGEFTMTEDGAVIVERSRACLRVRYLLVVVVRRTL